ncbi:MAG: radical SAM protein [Syntrophales bacterium]|nr:radical SAM protein [Syntrophales bacterium]
MISISKLYCGADEPGDAIRYGNSSARRPVVVWNVTRRCNLRCIHCYSSSKDVNYSNELTTVEAKQVIADLSSFGVPVLLFSGGEPLMRYDLEELVDYAVKGGLRVAISTNGTLISRETAVTFKALGVSYVGISFDGLGEVHDRFRGVRGAFDASVKGLINCRDAGLKVGVRFTVTRRNVSSVPGMFDFVVREGISRLCFYHLVYSGRASHLIKEDLPPGETRKLMDTLMDCTKTLFERGDGKEVLTVDNHADGPYIYLRLLRAGSERANEVLKLLSVSGGNSSGQGIGCISWDGEVYADQFLRTVSLGNVREKPFSEIWCNGGDGLLRMLRDRKRYLKGRCAHCRFLDLCGGNFRARAEAVTGDMWASDPACYLTDEEIGLRD